MSGSRTSPVLIAALALGAVLTLVGGAAYLLTGQLAYAIVGAALGGVPIVFVVLRMAQDRRSAFQGIRRTASASSLVEDGRRRR